LKKITLLFVFGLPITSFAQSSSLAPSVPATDTYHGIEVVDEYRNMENLEDTTVVNWMKRQTEFSDTTLKSISQRKEFLDRILKINAKTKFSYGGLRMTTDGSYFYTKMRNDEAVRKLYVRKGFNGEEKLLFDPKDFKPENNKKYLISYFNPSDDGSKVAIALTEGGKEIAEIIVYDLVANKVLPEILTNTWPSDLGGINWLPDGSGFLYVYIPNIDIKSSDFIKNTQSVVYKIGNKANDFKDIFSKSNNPEIAINKEDFPIVEIPSKFNGYIFGTVAGAARFSDYYYASVKGVYGESVSWKPFFSKEEKIKDFLADGNTVFFISEKNGTSRICKTSLVAPDFSNPEIAVNQIKDEIIKEMRLTKDGLFFSTLKNGVAAKLYFYDGKQYKSIGLPVASGEIYLQTSKSDLSALWVFCFRWTQDTTRYRYDGTTNTFTPENIRETADYSEYKDLIVEEIEIKTHDGQDLPLTIIYKKGLEKNGKNRVIMDGYGSYGSLNSPYFSPQSLLWVLDGGILVHTHVRGGGEKGDAWHNGGRKETKPNTWKDFISSAEYMIKERYTSVKYLGVRGGSAGGILIGRAITERPDLFKAAIIDVGVLNAIRFENTPNGPNTVKELGTVKNEEEFKALLEMDAFHHIRKGTNYPATLITAGLNDPRVIAWIPAKFAAKLQANNVGENPIFLDVDLDGGHGGDVSFNKIYEKMTDTYAFFYWQLGHPKYKLKE